jgi:heterodisulfide reductase subunit A-like polyferredoxin
MSKLQATSKENPLDVLVVGGGCTGSGTALDAATRGLSTALVERYDFGSETSSRSTKLIWAGVCVYIFITIVECVSFQYIIVNSPDILSLVVYIHY